VIESNGRWIIEENECVYGEYGEMVGKKPVLETMDNLGEV